MKMAPTIREDRISPVANSARQCSWRISEKEAYAVGNWSVSMMSHCFSELKTLHRRDMERRFAKCQEKTEQAPGARARERVEI